MSFMPTKDTRINLDPSVWGSRAWFFIDSACLSYPDNPSSEMQKQFKKFFYSLPFTIPCEKCRVHFNQFIKKYPLNDNILKSKDNLIIWILSAHNNVNKINKNNKNIKVDDFFKFYNDEYKTDVTVNTCKTKCEMPKEYNMINDNICYSDNYKMLSIVLFGILITLGLFLYRNMQINNN